MKKTKQKIVLFFYFVGFIALSRVIPHPPNFTPVIAIAVFMPYLTRSLYSAMLVPLSAMFGFGSVSRVPLQYVLGLHQYLVRHNIESIHNVYEENVMYTWDPTH